MAVMPSLDARRAGEPARRALRPDAALPREPGPDIEHLAQRLPRMALGHLGHGLGRTLGHDPAAARAPFGPQVHDPVRRLDHVEIMLDHHHGIARGREALKHFQQLTDIVEVQPGGRLVEDIKGLARPLLDQLAGQLDPLRLAAGECRRGLAKLDVVEPDVVQRLEHRGDLGDVGEVLEGLLHVHVEHVADALALVTDVQSLAAEPLALADRAGDPDVGEEIHFQPVRAVALAGLAPASRDVKAEPARRVAARFRLRHPGEQVANLVKQLDIGRRVGARSPADRRLVDINHLVEMLQPLDPRRVRPAR